MLVSASDASSVDIDASRQIAVHGVSSTLKAVIGVGSTSILRCSSSSVSAAVIVHSHFLFFSRDLRFFCVGLLRSLSAILLRISSNGPGVWPPSLVSSPEYAMADSSVSDTALSGSVAEHGESSAKSSMCDFTYLFVIMVCVRGSL